MYTEQDLKDISRQLKRRIAALLLPALFLLGGVILTFIRRNQTATILLFIILCFAVIFVYGLLISPLVKYRKFLASILYGANRTTEGYFKNFVAEQSERDGVLFSSLFLNISNSDDEEDDRLFYWDARLPLPDFQKGDKLLITSQDKAVIRWEKSA